MPRVNRLGCYCQTERDNPLRDAGEGPEAATRIPEELDAALHARGKSVLGMTGVIDAGGGFT